MNKKNEMQNKIRTNQKSKFKHKTAAIIKMNIILRIKTSILQTI